MTTPADPATPPDSSSRPMVDPTITFLNRGVPNHPSPLRMRHGNPGANHPFVGHTAVASSRDERKPKTYGANRVCSHEDCNTRLSIYNEADTCDPHTPRKVRRAGKMKGLKRNPN